MIHDVGANAVYWRMKTMKYFKYWFLGYVAMDDHAASIFIAVKTSNLVSNSSSVEKYGVFFFFFWSRTAC
jgi:hypothetical protein